MAAKHILYLTNAGLVSLVSRGGRLVSRRAFAAGPTGRDDFDGYLEDLSRLPTHILTDLAEEDFRLDTIPHLGGRDREAVLQRKLSQLFRNSPYRYAITQSREPEGRRDDRVVYTAITNGELLKPWLDILEKHEVPLEGIHSSAVFSERLLPDLGLTFPHTLLVTFTPGGTLRQTYFREREIKFSRLTPLDLEEEDTLGGLLAGETARTWQYLDSLRNFTPADRLEVCVLVHARDRAAVEPALRDFNQIRYRLVDMEQAAAQLGLKPSPATSSAEEILAHELVKRGATNHFAPPEARRFAQIRRARAAIHAVAGVIFAACLGYGGWNFWLAQQNRTQDEQTAQQVRGLQRETDSILQAMPTQGVAGDTMRDTVAFYSASLRAYPNVVDLLVPFSTVLERHPSIRITQAAWQASEDDNAMPSLAPTLPRNAPAIKAMAAKAAEAPPGAPPRPVDSADAPFASGRHSVALVEGTVTVGEEGFRKALAEVDRLVADIGKLPGYRARVVEAPIDITSRTAIQGRLGERPAPASDARFTVRISKAQEPAR